MGEAGNRDRQQDGNETKLVEDKTKIIMTEQSVGEMDLNDVKSKNSDKEEVGDTEKREEEKPDVSEQADMEKTKNEDRQQEGGNETTSAEDETEITTTEQPAEEMDLSDVKSKNSDDKAEVGDTEKPDVEKPDVSEKVDAEKTENNSQQGNENETTSAEDKREITKGKHLVRDTDLKEVKPTNSNIKAEVGDAEKFDKEKPGVSGKVDMEETKNGNKEHEDEKQSTSAENEMAVTTEQLDDKTDDSNTERGDIKNLHKKTTDDSENAKSVSLPGNLAKHSPPVSETGKDEPEQQDQASEALTTATTTIKTTNTQNKNTETPASNYTLEHARTINNHLLTDQELNSKEKIPDYIFKNLMIVNYHVREFELKSGEDKDTVEVNPMDAILGIFHRSDDSLRRYLTSKLSACQLSVPFLLPDPAAPSKNVTILLSALENITKCWKDSSGTKQVFATEHPFPVVSFIRIGKTKMSKSSLINKIMSDGDITHDFFFHKDMKGGHVERKVVDGLVEVNWYLPGESKGTTLKKEICFANLRGDARNFQKQLGLISAISSVLFILLPSKFRSKGDAIPKKMLQEAKRARGKTILIFKKDIENDAKKYFEDSEFSLIFQAKEKIMEIRQSIEININKVEASPLVALASLQGGDGVHLDVPQHLDLEIEERFGKWLNRENRNVKDLLKLQTHVPELADLEREKHSPKFLSSKTKPDGITKVAEKICEDIAKVKIAQRGTLDKLDERILRCLKYIGTIDETARDYTLNKLKNCLNKMSLETMPKLHEAYLQARLKLLKKKKKETSQGSETQSPEEKNLKDLKDLEDQISKHSFGLEHIIRELAQLYEIEESKYDYAGAAADMLLSGHLLEILDGDSFYIPLRWFKAVFNELEQKTNNANIFVISVVGIQSSGKSTMLNTMFGLEFPVSAARCTRGAFANLIPVSDSLKTASKFDYVLIIDTEGLSGSADSRLRKHDNQLATFAIGVANVTIVNIMGENENEMKEFLEIAIHAFLKMNMVEKRKTSCKIVHQNVVATDAKDKLTFRRFNLKKDLDQMTKLAAWQENCGQEYRTFDDIISFDEEADVFYIPSLLKGTPPMAPVNPDYGRSVQKVKETIIDLMYSEERMSEFQTKVKVALKRCSNKTQREEEWKKKEREIREEGQRLAEKMKEAMNEFFKTNQDKETLEQWKENVMNRIEVEKETQVRQIHNNCLSTFEYLQSLPDVEAMKQDCEAMLLENAKYFITSAGDIDDKKKFKIAFEKEWRQWIECVSECQVSKVNVNDEMVFVLRTTDKSLEAEMGKKLEEKNNDILNFRKDAPDVESSQLKYFPSKIYSYKKFVSTHLRNIFTNAGRIEEFAAFQAVDFAENALNSGFRCTRNVLTQMYHNVITAIEEETEEIRKSSKCDILLYAFAETYEIFDKMEERFIQERDIRGDLERNLRPMLEKYFRDICEKMEKEVLAATSFVRALETPIESALNSTMGRAVAREIMKETTYKSKSQFHANVLIQLGKGRNFDSYKPYLANPVEFLKRKLMESIENYCLDHVKSILEDKITGIQNNVFAAIKTANEKTRAGNKKLTFWIQQFVEECSILVIKEETFALAAIENLDNIEVFQVEVHKKVNLFVKSFIDRGFDVEAIRTWNPSPGDIVFNKIIGCESVCPFCKALCDHTVSNHPGKHSTLSHRPQGICGCRKMRSKVLVTEICTMCVAGEGTFGNDATSWKYLPYKNYQSVNDYYKSWSIPPDPSFESSKYFQWFMATFSKELAEYYEVKEPDIPEAWKRVTFSEAKEDLEHKHHL
ncbi:interferon-induced very large GTPase 1-like [Dendronephthya gigantea]|uniref:interferon-induced very large GTPase 1-like n=1 Tax=Dendronephthya gigantea TaxID=151771 RepID=UPI00106CF986|nr:interferon-induced very large GTPase 1-like [Dendronephthya gigantea]